MTGPTVVVGTAGHIDHGKTTLLRALTGIDADRLPEERRRGMTIDVGYAHLDLPDGTAVDFVDVPGHDRLVGNMLVGAGEIDAAMLVVAADDGPRAQTFEHLELLDALGVRHGIAVVTKVDAAAEERVDDVAAAVRAVLASTTLSEVPVLAVSATAGRGLDALRQELIALRDRAAPAPGGGASLAIDRVFTVRGRGTVVTGTLRGGAIGSGEELVVLPDGPLVRVREVQVHNRTVDRAVGGRTALLLGGMDPAALRRGQVLARTPMAATSRLLVALGPTRDLQRDRPVPPPDDGSRLRLHLRTDQADALVVRSSRETAELPDGAVIAILRLERSIAAWPGDRFALRDPSRAVPAVGGVVLDPRPSRGISRRRATPERLAALHAAATGGTDALRDTLLALHGIGEGPAPALAPDVAQALTVTAIDTVARHHAADPRSVGPTAAAVREQTARAARRLATVRRDAAEMVANAVIQGLLGEGRLARDADRLRDPARSAGLPPDVLAAMDRLEAALASAAPPSLSQAARETRCPPDGIRALETEGRIVRLEDDLAWAASTYRDLARTAVTMAAAAPLTPAAFRDATGSSRRYVLVILEDLDRRELLRRTDAGHVLGRRALARARPAQPATP